MDGENFLSVDQAAERLMLSAATVRRLIRTRQLSAIRVGQRKWRIPETAIEEHLTNGASPAIEKKPVGEGEDKQA